MFSLTAPKICGITGGELFGEGAARGVSTDTRKINEGNLFFAIKGPNLDGNAFLGEAFQKGAAVCVGSIDFTPPKGRAYIKVPDTLKALGALAAWWRSGFDIVLLGVTGSAGKTTTKEMAALVLSEKYKTHKTPGNFNNEIGLPLTLLELGKEHEAAVVEMGMNAPGEISRLTGVARPTLALITNIGKSHIGNLGSMENILSAKLEILEGLHPGGRVILNGDDPLLWKQRGRLPFETVYFGIENKECDILGECISDSEFKVLGERITLPVPGRHNIYNALAAIAAGTISGIGVSDAARGLSRFEPVGMRQSIVYTKAGAEIINDCYNASPTSMKAALELLAGREGMRKIAVLGDMLELGEYTEREHYNVGYLAAKLGIDYLLAVGENRGSTAEGAKAGGMRPERIFPHRDNDSAAEHLAALLKEGDVCLIKGSRGVHMEEIASRLV